MKKIGEKAFAVQDPTGKMKRVFAEHMQFMYAAEYYLTALSQKEIFGRTAKYNNHSDLMPDLYKDLEETNKNKEIIQVSRMMQTIPITLLIITICIQEQHTDCEEIVT